MNVRKTNIIITFVVCLVGLAADTVSSNSPSKKALFLPLLFFLIKHDDHSYHLFHITGCFGCGVLAVR